MRQPERIIYPRPGSWHNGLVLAVHLQPGWSDIVFFRAQGPQCPQCFILMNLHCNQDNDFPSFRVLFPVYDRTPCAYAFPAMDVQCQQLRPYACYEAVYQSCVHRLLVALRHCRYYPNCGNNFARGWYDSVFARSSQVTEHNSAQPGLTRQGLMLLTLVVVLSCEFFDEKRQVDQIRSAWSSCPGAAGLGRMECL